MVNVVDVDKQNSCHRVMTTEEMCITVILVFFIVFAGTPDMMV